MKSSQLVLIGWFLFMISGLFFLADAIETGDRTALGAAVTWLLGIVFFVWSMRDTEE